MAKLEDYLSLTINETVPKQKQKQTKLKTDYILLRNATCARLTLFNARRGGEPSRLLLSDLQEGLNDSWLPGKQQIKIVDEIELSLLESLKVTYFVGKRNRLVPLILPKDTIQALQYLSSPWFRKEAGSWKINILILISGIFLNPFFLAFNFSFSKQYLSLGLHFAL